MNSKKCVVFDLDGTLLYTLEDLKNSSSLGKLGRTENVADAIYFLASSEADFITGQVLGVDGGFLQ